MYQKDENAEIKQFENENRKTEKCAIFRIEFHTFRTTIDILVELRKL